MPVVHPRRDYTFCSLNRSNIPVVIAVVIVAGARIATMPRGFWHADELRLAQALLTFDPPRDALYVGFARVLNVVIRDPFLTLVIMSVAASIALAYFAALLTTRLLGSAWLGAAVALLLSFSPAMIVFGSVPGSQIVSAACVAAALFYVVERKPVLVVVALVVAIGMRLDLPPEAPDLVRFYAHPWGDKARSLPILAAAAIGFAISIRRFREPVFIALAACSAWCFLSSAALPAMLMTAFLAVTAVSRWPGMAMVLVSAFSTASLMYALPAVVERTRDHGPAVEAMRYAKEAGFAVVATGDLAVFASHDLSANRLLVHGRSQAPGAITFEAPVSEACGKLHGDRFHRVSLVPQPHRIASSRGVYDIESSPELGEWRWLAKEAVIEMDGTEVSLLRFRLPEDAPVAANRLSVGGKSVQIHRGSTATLHLPHASRVVIRADRSFAPGDGRELAVQLLHIR